MAKNPDERFQTATEFKEALLNMVNAPDSTSPSLKPLQSKTMVLLFCVGALILTAIICFYKFTSNITRSHQEATKPQTITTNQTTDRSTSWSESGTGDDDDGDPKATTDAGLIALLKDPGVAKSDALRLDHSAISDAGLNAIANDTNLVRLSCSQSNITDLSGPIVGSLTRLEKLNVSSTVIGNQFLKDISSLKNLWYLWCGNTRVTDSGLAYLAAFPLKVLHLTHTVVGDAGMVHLSKLLWQN